MKAALLLPGERTRSEIRPGRAVVAALAGTAWLILQSSVLPQVGLWGLPFDPLLPLVAAFALGGRGMEAWILALFLGYLADFFGGASSGRILLRYALVVCMALPLHGRVVLRDRLVPVLGVAVFSAVAGAVLLVLLTLMGAEQSADWAKVPIESLGTAAAAFICWPLYRRIAGWEDDRTTRARRRLL
jgi:rod shape-determining protein MreD